MRFAIREITMRAIRAAAIVVFFIATSCSPAPTAPASMTPEVATATDPGGVWLEVNGVPVRADVPHAALARGGRALVVEVGSFCPAGPAGAAYEYDATTSALGQAPQPPRLGDGIAMAAMADGRILIAGGLDADGNPGNQAYIWDPSGGIWADGPRLRFRRDRAALTALQDGRVLLTGGSTLSPEPPGDMITGTDATEIYDPLAGVWATASGLPIGFDQEPFATTLPGGQVLVVPDWFANQETPSSALYDPAAGTWTTMAAPVDFDGFTAALVALPDGTALAIDSDGAVARFDTASGWRRAGALLTGRFEPAVAVLPDGRVLVAGGVLNSDANSSATPALRTAELFDPGSGRSTEVSSMPAARFGDVAIALDDGSILVVGGRGVTEAEIHATPEPDDPLATPPEEEGPEPTPRCPPDSFPALRWIP